MTIATRHVPRMGLPMADDDHEQIVVRQDKETGLRYIVAVHSTVLGPALGGMRIKRYPGGLREALEDVMGLARTMTLKASAAGLDLGGGKSVMIDDGRPELREARLEAAARVIDGLDGAYITAEDIGTTTEDMDHMARFTRYAVGRSEADGGGGDPSPVTAETVFQAMRRGLAAATGSDDFDGRRIGVVGLGKVGSALAAKLAEAGAHVIGCDLDAERAHRLADELGIAVAPSAEAILADRAGRAGAVRRRRPDRRGARPLDRLPRGGGRREQPADGPRRRAHADAARHRVRARLPGQLRRADPRLPRVVAARQEGAPRGRPDRRCDGAARLRPRDRRGRRHHTHRGGRAPGARARGGRAKVGSAVVTAGYPQAGLESSFEPVSSRRTFEEAVEQIAERIKSGDLHVGDRLPSERELAGIMRISRPTLREAVKTLVEAGVLEVRRGQSGGIFVASELIPRDLLRSRQAIRVSEVAGVLEARRLLEPRVAQLAAVHASEEDFAAMAALIERKRTLAAADDFLENEDLFLQLDLKFHLAMARATRNSTVVQLMRSLFRRLEIARDMAVHAPLVPDWVISIHERTLAAIRAADFELIDAVMDEHLAQLEQIWERETGRGLVRPLPDFLQAVADRSRALRAG